MRIITWILGVFLCAMFSACSAPAPSESAPPSRAVLIQDWELGGGGWTDRSGQPPTLVSDPSLPAGQVVQQINRVAVGGDYFSPLVDVVGGQSYCIRAKVKWVSGAAPFVGVEQYANGIAQGVTWLIGSRYTDERGTTTVVSSSDTGWQEFGETLTMSYDTTQVRLVDEAWEAGSKGGTPLAYFDDILLDSGSCTAVTPMPYIQNWEAGVGNWKDLSGQAPTLVTDTSSTAGQTVQQINRATTGGDYFSPLLDVVGGRSYCLRAKLKWVSGGAPFVGVEQYANHVSQGVSWLIGTQYSDDLGSTTVISSSDTGWQELSKTLSMPYYTNQVRLVDEAWAVVSKGGNPLVYFDGISLENGTCTPMPYTQDWESGVGNWKDLSGQAPTLVTDASSSAGPTVQQVNRSTATASGDYFSPLLDVQPYQSYCIRAKFKWVSGAAPFVGIEQYANGVSQGVSWLMGTRYSDAWGSTTVISSSDTGWQEYGSTLYMSYNTTQVRLVDELYQPGSKGGDPLAHFDGFSIDTGSCSPPYTQDWESGTGSWKDLSGQAPTLVTDTSSPVGQTVQQVNRVAASASGDYFSPLLDVVGEQVHCIRANIKWVSGAAPFVGIEQYANGVSQGVTWLIGSQYKDEGGSTTVVSSSNTGWQAMATPLPISADTTQVRLVDKLFEGGSKGGTPLAYFDGISIDSGDCGENPLAVAMSTDKWSYLVGEPVLINWSSPHPISGRIGLSSRVSVDVAPALAGSQTFENLPEGYYEVYFLYASSGYYNRIGYSTFSVAAGVTDKVEYVLGAPVVVNWGNLGVPGGRVVIAPAGSDLSAATASSSVDLSTAGSYTFTDLPIGDYEVRFLDGSSQLLGTASMTISVYPRLTASKPSLVPSDFIVVSWRAPLGAQDWVAIAPDGSSDTTVTDWVYTGGEDGSHAFGPLAVGTYRARYFQNGTTTKLHESEALQVRALTQAEFTQVDAGANHTCGVTPEHKVKCWGANWNNQLGDGTWNSSGSAIEVAGISTATAVSSGDHHTCAVTSDGKVRCWGSSWYGELGDGTWNTSGTLNEVAGISAATAVSNGYGHTCAVTSDGKVRCWGQNSYGKLGDGTRDDSSTPVQVVGISTATAVSSGFDHTCSMTSDGKVRCWGYNGYGQLGNGTRNDSGLPVKVAGISTATAVGAGYGHTCVATSDGKARCWGHNGFGQLGDGTTVDSDTPVEVTGISNAVAISLGDYHSCARLSDGTVRCWGTNGSRQLGNRTTADSAIPVEVIGVTNTLGVTSGGSHTCALLSGGNLQCWGDNLYGQLGNDATRSSAEISGFASASSLSVGGSHVCTSSIDGKVRCWGYNGYGQLGDGTNINRGIPTELGITNVVSVNAADSNTCAVASDGKVRCWGANWYGQLGDGTYTNSATPVEVAGLSAATAVGTGYYQTCALTSDGKVHCWGNNGYGELGDGTGNDSVIPVEVAGISNATAVGSGEAHACAVTSDGNVRCWGYNGYGQLGNKTNADSPSPVGVFGITNAVSIDLGSNYSCARLNDGKVMCWGANWYGQLGDGTNTDHNVPIEMGGVDNAIAVSAGYLDTCVWHSDDKLRCWGDNSYGQFGDGKHPYALVPVTVMSLQ